MASRLSYVGIYLGFTFTLIALGFAGYRGGRIWTDAGKHGFTTGQRLAWSIAGIVAPARYWWGARITVLSPQEQADLLARETEGLGLSRADSLRCPLCNSEVHHAWALTAKGSPSVAPGPVECPHCDFRLDACRHCSHFLPGDVGPPAYNLYGFGATDYTSGRCSIYEEYQPVESVCTPAVARQMRVRGLSQVRRPMRIIDSYLPPGFCTAFRPEPKRIKASQVQWPDVRRTALLHLLIPRPGFGAETSEQLPSSGDDDARWLL